MKNKASVLPISIKLIYVFIFYSGMEKGRNLLNHALVL